MNLRLNRYDETPAGGWRYKEPETGRWITATSWKLLLRAVRAYLGDNNLPVPIGLDATIEQRLCEIVPPEYCGGATHISAPAHPLTLAEAIEGTKVVLGWVAGWCQKVEPTEAERRAVICSRCHFNQPVKDCARCSLQKLHELTERITAGYPVAHDYQLEICSVCGCSLRAKVRMPLELLQKHLSDFNNDRLPEWCWLKKHDPQDDSHST